LKQFYFSVLVNCSHTQRDSDLCQTHFFHNFLTQLLLNINFKTIFSTDRCIGRVFRLFFHNFLAQLLLNINFKTIFSTDRCIGGVFRLLFHNFLTKILLNLNFKGMFSTDRCIDGVFRCLSAIYADCVITKSNFFISQLLVQKYFKANYNGNGI
jgi:tryptophan-rich sensory protein